VRAGGLPRFPQPEEPLFPLRDENPTSLTPVFTILFVLANVAVWMLVQGGGMSFETLSASVCRFGAIPAEITGQTSGYRGVQLDPGAPACEFGGLTRGAVLTSMFLHGGWLHLLANMWFLWLFGNNIEDSMGHLRFVAFYLVVGVGAALAHVFSAPGSPVPVVGASGAISGLMGAYLVLYPRVRIQTLFILIIFIRVIPLPAWLVLVYWFALQVLSGTLAPLDGGGVAFWAHVGGFVAGAVLVKPFENRQLVEARRRHVVLSPFEIQHRGWL
jgi:membrane associated rhomboid family serine protease